MNGVAIGAAAMAMVLAGPAPVESPSFSPGIGYTVAQLQRARFAAEAPTTTRHEVEDHARFAPRLPPPRSDFQRIQGSPRARGLHAAAAIAAELAMIVAGIMAVREQREQARRARVGEPEPYRPYPR